MAIKFKHIWDRIFAKYNTTYSSTFLNTTRFKSVVYLDTHKNASLSNGQYNLISASVNRNSNTPYSLFAIEVPVIFNVETQDAGNRYNTTTGVYTVNSTRNHVFSTALRVRGALRAINNIVISTPRIVTVYLDGEIRKNNVRLGVVERITQLVTIPVGTYTAGQLIEYTIVDDSKTFLNIERTWDAAVGDLITIVVLPNFITSTGFSPDVSILAGSLAVFRPEQTQLVLNDTYNKNSVPASQHKQKDFIIDVLRMFNLYLLWDGVNYIIEPRDNFYTLGTQLDWTQKIDRSQEITITPVGQLNWRQIQLMAKKDADYYSDQYYTNNKEVYGQQNVFNQNQFITETKKVELTFAPPLSVSTRANYPKLQHIYKLNNGVAEAIDGLPRYGYWAGWKEEGNVLSQITGAGANVEYDGYAYVGEFDDPIAPTFSVLFGPPREVYYRTFGTLAITDNDLYSAYYQNELMNQVSENAKLITCYVYLTPLEINNLKLYDLVVVDGVNCIISKISDYNTTTIQPTQVELIQFIQ
jgi:hypothetical protein